MPLAYIKYQGPSSVLGLWHLTEDESFFLREVDQLVTNQAQLATIHHSYRFVYLNFDGIWTDEYNKPHLVLQNAHISLSHATPYVVAILDVNSYCGIDVERLRDKLLPLSPKFLSKPEIEIADQDVENLAVLWGAKEALYKLHGRKSLIFKDNLRVSEFNYKDGRGNFKGVIELEKQYEEYRMESWKFGDYVLVYTNGLV